jgi:hypothetical protein
LLTVSPGLANAGAAINDGNIAAVINIATERHLNFSDDFTILKLLPHMVFMSSHIVLVLPW